MLGSITRLRTRSGAFGAIFSLGELAMPKKSNNIHGADQKGNQAMVEQARPRVRDAPRPDAAADAALRLRSQTSTRSLMKTTDSGFAGQREPTGGRAGAA